MPLVEVRQVDDAGLLLDTTAPAEADRAVDVLFDDRRVWSFHLLRDTEREGRRQRLARWPNPLRRYLDGWTRLELRDSASGETWYAGDVQMGSAEDRIQVISKVGLELCIDKSGRLVPTFETRDERDIAQLLEALSAVLAALEQAGVRPFVGYGTLLGAIREGGVLGHDNDADICYVSDAGTPAEVTLESFRLQRALHEQGYDTVRYSGAAFKVLVTEADGFRRGMDVFSGFLDGGRLYLMGEVGVPFERDWLDPRGTAQLDGVTVPVPARPERLLEAMYGSGWQVPDPAFVFETPAYTTRALNDWFRGLRPGFRYWQRRYALNKSSFPKRGPSALARAAHERAAATGATVLDVGAGKGPDAVWLAGEGVRTIAYDYVAHSLDVVAARCREQGLPLETRILNLTEWRSWIHEGARLSRERGPRVVLAQHILDATTPMGREGLIRFCSMVLRGGGTLFAQVHVGDAVDEKDWCLPVDLENLEVLLESAGATDVDVRMPKRPATRQVARIVAEWAP